MGVKIKVNLFWLGKENLKPDKTYFLKCGTAKIEMRLEKVERVVNASDLSCISRQYVEKNEVAECILKLDRPIAFDLAGSIEATSRFVIVDEYEIAGGGIITEAMKDEAYDDKNIRWSSDAMTSAERSRMLGNSGLVVWMTGLSGSGKTTVAQEVERRLVAQGVPAYVLDGDKLRSGLNKDLGFSEADRKENIRRTTEIARMFKDAGIVTFVTLISPFEEARQKARAEVGNGFLEVYMKADVETCRQRDPKKLYEKALRGEIKSFTGIDSPYEVPKNPDLLLDTELWSEEECAEALLSTVLTKIRR